MISASLTFSLYLSIPPASYWVHLFHMARLRTAHIRVTLTHIVTPTHIELHRPT